MGTEQVIIEVPYGMRAYIEGGDPETALIRNAMILYPHIQRGAISQDRAAQVLGIPKARLLRLYDGMVSFSKVEANGDSVISDKREQAFSYWESMRRPAPDIDYKAELAEWREEKYGAASVD